MSSGKVIEGFDDFVNIDKYCLEVQSIHTHWDGSDSGKMEDMPGDFLVTKVFLKEIQSPDTLESLAMELKVNELEEYCGVETTSQPKSYANFLHEARVDEVKNQDPDYYKRKIRSALKKIL